MKRNDSVCWHCSWRGALPSKVEKTHRNSRDPFKTRTSRKFERLLSHHELISHLHLPFFAGPTGPGGPNLPVSGFRNPAFPCSTSLLKQARDNQFPSVSANRRDGAALSLLSPFVPLNPRLDARSFLFGHLFHLDNSSSASNSSENCPFSQVDATLTLAER